MRLSLRKLLLVAKRVMQEPQLPLAQRYPKHSIGRGSYGDLKLVDCGEGAKLTIGAYTSIAAGVTVFLGCEHRSDWVTTYPFNILWSSARHYEGHPKTKGDVVIGSDVWIGAEAMILSGVNIGNGAVIGARSVISRDVPSYAIVAGNPARVVKHRFSPEIAQRLLVTQWWSWSEEQISQAMPDLLNQDIEVFLNKAESGAYL